MKTQDLSGQKFHLLTVIKEVRPYESPTGQIQACWLCKCDCGTINIVRASNLKSGAVKSCGCIGREKFKKIVTKHGLSYHPLYRIWAGMKSRCCNPNDIGYKNYGGRGIGICDEWKNNVVIFISWALENGWKKGLTIDRINNNTHYKSENCRFVTQKINCQNKRVFPGKSGYTGIQKAGNKWEVDIFINRKKFYIGVFSSIKKAITIRNNFIIHNNLPNKIQTFKSNIAEV